MAEAVVSFLIAEISVFLKEEKKILGGVRGDVQFIRHELEHIKAFLRAAELMEERADSRLSAWVNEVREIAFEIEDTLDEYKLHLRGDGRGAVCKLLKNLTHRHGIASQLQQLKSRIKDASERPLRYQFNLSTQIQPSPAVTSAVAEQRGNALLAEENELVGIDGPKKELTGWLLEGDDDDGDTTVGVFSVVGAGGLGKTTLVKKAYDEFAVQRHFKIHVWVTVSQSFKPEELLRKLFHQVCKERKQPIPEEIELMEGVDLKQMIKDTLRGSRYLLVLDDVWQVDAWDVIRPALPGSEHSSRVILTTRNENVAEASSSDSSKGKLYRLEPLSSELSWKLFCTKTFREDQQCPPRLTDIAAKIIKKCRGLPLAIVAVSGVLAAKRNGSAEEWEMVSRNLSSEPQSDRMLTVKRILSLSYNELPFNLKACMLHLSMLPEDLFTDRSYLIPLWVAEGFVEEQEGRTPEEVAHGYLDELLARNLVIMDDLKIAHGVHDLVREVMLSKAKDQSFAAVVDSKTMRWPESARRLSIHHTAENTSDGGRSCGLRSLMVFGVNDFPLAPLCSNSRLLKVVDMEKANLETFPEEITKLYHLKFLRLSGRKITRIPSTIAKLRNLQHLDIRGTSVGYLPPAVLKLQQLRHLLLQIFFGYIGMGSLTSLQTLRNVAIYLTHGVPVILELGKLTQLRSLWIVIPKREYGPALCFSIEKLKLLQELAVISNKEENIDLEAMSSPPKFLAELILKGPLNTVPSWIQSLNCLRVLSFCWSQLCYNFLEVIQNLPNLHHLSLEDAFQGDELVFNAQTFQKLTILGLEELGALQRVDVQRGSMPGLVYLSIQNCPSLENVPFGVEHLSKLKLLSLGNVSEDLVKKMNEDEEDYERLKHVNVVAS